MLPDKLTSLARLTDALSRARSAGEVYDASLDCLQESLGVDRASILLFDENEVMTFVASRGISDDYRRAVNGHTPWRPDSTNLEPVLVADATLDPALASYEEIFRIENIRALGFFALTHGDRVIGKFMLYYAEPHDFTNEEIALAKTIAGQIAFGVTRIVAEEEVRVERERNAFFAEAAGLLSASLDYEKSLAQIADLIVGSLGDWCLIDLVEEDEVVRIAAAHRDSSKGGTMRRLQTEFAPSKHEIGIGRRVFESNVPLLLETIDAELAERLRHSAAAPVLDELGCESLLVVPMTAGGRVFGTIAIASTSARHYDRNDLAIAVELGIRAGYTIDHAHLYRTAQAANRTKDEFLATLSHELRTPMTAALGWASMLRAGGLTHETQQLAAETIERSIRTQAKLIDDIFDVSRIVTGKLQLHVVPVVLEQVIAAAVETMQPGIQAKSLRLEIESENADEVLLGDSARLQQVIWNLLSNAVKFTPNHGVIRIEVKRPSGDTVELSVRDSGQGIAKKLLPFVFDRFRQGDSSVTRAHGGLGLGLAIVKSIVELHGGTVAAESEGEGHGARFTIRLPRAEGRRGVAASHATDSRISLAGVTVLVVEDDDDTRVMMSRALEQHGANVIAVGSAAAALDALRGTRPNVMVSDIAMPGEDGVSLMMKIRGGAVESCRDLPAIAVSAFARPEDRERILAAGFHEQLAKPVDAFTMLKSVAKFRGYEISE